MLGRSSGFCCVTPGNFARLIFSTWSFKYGDFMNTTGMPNFGCRKELVQSALSFVGTARLWIARATLQATRSLSKSGALLSKFELKLKAAEGRKVCTTDSVIFAGMSPRASCTCKYIVESTNSCCRWSVFSWKTLPDWHLPSNVPSLSRFSFPPSELSFFLRIPQAQTQDKSH